MSASHTFSAANYTAAIDAAIMRRLNYEILDIRKGLVAMLSKKGSGVGYRGGRKGKGMFRTRSAPGEPPAVDTGRLRQSVTVAAPQGDSTDAVKRVYLAGFAKYGWMLESGTSRIAPRPWIAPTLNGRAAGIQRRLSDTIAKAIARAGAAR